MSPVSTDLESAGTIRATFELQPPGSADALALEESLGLPEGPDFVRGRVLSEEGGRGVVEFPAANWGRNVPLLLSAIVAGEAGETRHFTRCRLVRLDLPAGFLPGPAVGAISGSGVGLIVKPSLGLSPPEVAGVAEAAAAGGARLLKDDELLGDPEWCPLEDRVRAVTAAVGDELVYCPNITGPSATLFDRARRVVEIGARGLMINAFAQGLDSLLSLREQNLGVPILAHRVVSGPMTRCRDFGASGSVLVELLRWCGADFVLAGAFEGKLFDSDAQVASQIAAARDERLGVLPATVLLGGGIGPDNARLQAERAGCDGLILLLGSAAYRRPEGLRATVARTVKALESARR